LAKRRRGSRIPLYHVFLFACFVSIVLSTLYLINAAHVPPQFSLPEVIIEKKTLDEPKDGEWYAENPDPTDSFPPASANEKREEGGKEGKGGREREGDDSSAILFVTPEPTEAGDQEEKDPSTIPSVAFLRILGNDLPPRHSPNQTLDNLAFILRHEPDFPHCEKIWILNRIVDQEKEKTIRQLLLSYNQTFYAIPFNASEYRNVPLDFEAFHHPLFLFTKGLGMPAAFDHIYRHKNLYLINNNGARNFALKLGIQRGARWVLPFDGNGFIPKANYNRLLSSLQRAEKEDKRYIVVPMVRFWNSQDVLGYNAGEGEEPKAFEEPQIGFHAEASLRFDESIRYGRRPKVELLCRLGVLGIEEWKQLPWESPLEIDSAATGQVSVAATWIARLSSGADPQLEMDNARRGSIRSQSVREFVDGVDFRLWGGSPRLSLPFFYSLDTLQREREEWKSGSLREGFKEVTNLLASEAATHLSEELPGGLAKPPSRSAPAFRKVINGIVILTLASYIFHDSSPKGLENAGDIATSRILHLFGSNSMLPPPKGNDKAGFGDLYINLDLHLVLDSAKLLHEQGKLGKDGMASVKEWFSTYSLWGKVKKKSLMYDLHSNGTAFQLQQASIHGSLGDFTHFRWFTELAKARLAVLASGKGPEKDWRSILHNLLSFVDYAALFRLLGEDIWNFTPTKGKVYESQFERAFQRAEKKNQVYLSVIEILTSELRLTFPSVKNETVENLPHLPKMIWLASSMVTKEDPKSKDPGEHAYFMPQIPKSPFQFRPFWSLGRPQI